MRVCNAYFKSFSDYSMILSEMMLEYSSNVSGWCVLQCGEYNCCNTDSRLIIIQIVTSDFSEVTGGYWMKICANCSECAWFIYWKIALCVLFLVYVCYYLFQVMLGYFFFYTYVGLCHNCGACLYLVSCYLPFLHICLIMGDDIMHGCKYVTVN